MAHETETYEVEYRYYQYNSGQADNGEYVRTRSFRTAEEAQALAARINASAQKKMDEDEERELQDDLIPWDGYFLGATAFRAVRTPLPALGDETAPKP